MPYEIKLPHKFLIWWAIGAPKKTLRIAGTVLAMANNELSFMMNIRLILVPLYGNKTITGRTMSFVVRFFMIIFGFFFMIILLVGTMLLPILWVAVPFALAYFSSMDLAIVFMLALYAVWVINNLDVPNKKVGQINNSGYIKSFRPAVRDYLDITLKNQKQSLKELLNKKEIVYLLKKSELNIKELKKSCAPPLKFRIMF